MKIKTLRIPVLLILLICCCAGTLGEESEQAALVPGEEWSWSRGAYNNFSGQISLKEYTGTGLTVTVRAEIPYTETEQESLPVFTSVNGKRIVMTKQSDTVHFTPDADHPDMAFSVSFRLPDKTYVTSVPFVFTVTDDSGKEMCTIRGRIDSDEDGSGQSGNPFYIPADIGMITAVIAGAAAGIWIIVILRGIYRKKNRKTGAS